MDNGKTVVSKLIEFIKSDEYKYLYDSVIDEWFNTFLENEKIQIKNAYDNGELMAIRKERLDYCEEDQIFTNSEEYYNSIIK